MEKRRSLSRSLPDFVARIMGYAPVTNRNAHDIVRLGTERPEDANIVLDFDHLAADVVDRSTGQSYFLTFPEGALRDPTVSAELTMLADADKTQGSNVSRRGFLQLAAVAAASLTPFLNVAEAYASKPNIITESNRAARERIRRSIFERDGRMYLRVGELDLPIIDPRNTPSPAEYENPFDNGVPLVELSKDYLGRPVTRNFKLHEFGLVPNPAYNKNTGVEMIDFNGRTINRFVRLDPSLPLELQALRDSYANPLQILSPYRTVTYNQIIGGEDQSRHKSGQAADLSASDVSKLDMLADKQFSQGGVGYYPKKHFVHVDTRGFKTRWKR